MSMHLLGEVGAKNTVPATVGCKLYEPRDLKVEDGDIDVDELAYGETMTSGVSMAGFTFHPSVRCTELRLLDNFASLCS